MNGNYGPVIFGSPVAVKVGDYLTFERFPAQRAVVLREATVDEFLVSRAEREPEAPSATLIDRCRTAYFYEVQTD